ncbi:MAG: Ig-like domain-containing protein [Mycoplasmoidaceae bacterium]
MKKWKIIFPSLLATTSIPLVSLTECGNNSKPVEELKSHVYFNNGGHGVLSGDLEIEVNKGTRWCDLVEQDKIPEPEGMSGWLFGGWYKGEQELQTSDETIIEGNWSVTARFNEPSPDGKYGVNFFPSVNGTLTGDVNIRVAPGTLWSSDEIQSHLPIAKPDTGYGFEGWYRNNIKIIGDFAVTNDTIIVAQFKPLIPDPKSVVLNKNSMALDVGNSEKLFANVLPHDAKQDVTWTSSDESIAKVVDGVVTGINHGTATITATATGSTVSASCNVNVVAYSVDLLNKPEDGFEIKDTSVKPKTKLDEEITSLRSMSVETVDYVLVDGQPIKGWTFKPDTLDNKKGILSIPASLVTGNIAIHCDPTSRPLPVDFETDSWETIAFYANQGLDVLCKEYNHEPDWFLGKTRELEINGQKHHVMVVGTNQDTYTKDNITYSAALTFQFNTLISNKEDGSYLRIDWEPDKSNKNYWDGALENALNGTENNVQWYDTTGHTVSSDQQISVYKMIKASDPLNAWTNLIKSVDRTVNVYDAEEQEWLPKEKQGEPCKIFVPTLSNLFSEYGIRNSTIQAVIDHPEDQDSYCSEGQITPTLNKKQYAYYAQEGKIGPTQVLDNETTLDCLRIRDVAHYGQSTEGSKEYWLSSPMLHSEWTADYYIWGVSNLSSGNPHIFGWVSDWQCAVAPCFCL